jgi:hypothetical protein
MAEHHSLPDLGRKEDMKRAPIIAMACLLAALSLSCRRRREVYPTSQPSNAAVAGKYAVFGDSEVIKQHGATGTLDLCPDGTFVMRNMPGCGAGLLRRGKAWNGRGRWSVINARRALPSVSHTRPFWLRLDLDEIAGKRVYDTDWSPYFVGKAEPYDIHIPIIDPLDGSGGRVLILRMTGEPVLPTSGHLEKNEEREKGQASD